MSCFTSWPTSVRRPSSIPSRSAAGNSPRGRFSAPRSAVSGTVSDGGTHTIARPSAAATATQEGAERELVEEVAGAADVGAAVLPLLPLRLDRQIGDESRELLVEEELASGLLQGFADAALGHLGEALDELLQRSVFGQK